MVDTSPSKCRKEHNRAALVEDIICARELYEELTEQAPRELAPTRTNQKFGNLRFEETAMANRSI